MTAYIPIIACSAFSKSEEREEALRAGMVDYLQKRMPPIVLNCPFHDWAMVQTLTRLGESAFANDQPYFLTAFSMAPPALARSSATITG